MVRRHVLGMPMLSGLTGMVLFTAPAPAAACSVCFGDPNSPMAKGAVMGVVVMLGVVGCVLAAVAGTGLYWIQRGRRLALDADHSDGRNRTGTAMDPTGGTSQGVADRDRERNPGGR